MFAVIKTGGKQEIVREGQLLTTEKLEIEVGKPVEFEVLLTAEDDGSSVEVGKPVLKTVVKGTVVEHGKGDKVSVIKYKAKSRYRRNGSHRQPFTKVKIEKIG